MATTNITMRIDVELKSQLQDLVSNLGMDMTTFFTMAAKQAVREQALPFLPSLDVPNSETLAAMKEAEKMAKHPERYKSYHNFDEILNDLTEEESCTKS